MPCHQVFTKSCFNAISKLLFENFSRRKSLTGNWKTNVGQSILEEVPVQVNYFFASTTKLLNNFDIYQLQDRHRAWIDLVAEMFGGLDLCSLEALVARDGTEVIIEVNDCAMGLLGESQEEDRRNIAEVRISRVRVTFEKGLRISP